MAADQAPAADLRAAILRIAETRDGRVLFDYLHGKRKTAFESMSRMEGIPLHRVQGAFNTLQDIFSHNDLTDSKPR